MEKTGKLWFALDGIDATGKSLQSVEVSRALKERGYRVKSINEFSQSLIGKLLRDILESNRFISLSHDNSTPFADTSLLIADMVFKVEKEIKGAEEEVFISDRGLLSLIAYQATRIVFSNMKHDLFLTSQKVMNLAHQHLIDLLIPSRHVFYAISMDVMQNRLVKRGESLLSAQEMDFLGKAQSLMLNLADNERCKCIDVSFKSPQAVTQETVEYIINIIE